MRKLFEKFLPPSSSVKETKYETENAQDSEAKIKDEFLVLKATEGGCEQVPYPPRMGINWRVSEKPLLTGFLSDQRLIDCCALTVFAEGRAGLMHISPNTLPEDDFPHASRSDVYHKNVDVQYLAMLEKLGNLKSGIIVAGDVDLALVLQGFIKGGANYWGKTILDESSRLQQVQNFRLGTGGKELIAIPDKREVLVCDYTNKHYYRFVLGTG